MTSDDKAAILDWLLTPAPSGRADRPDRLSRSINRNSGQALLVFHAWCSPEEALEALHLAAEIERRVARARELGQPESLHLQLFGRAQRPQEKP